MFKSFVKILLGFLGLSGSAQIHSSKLKIKQIIENKDYKRYILIKGEKLQSVEQILQEYVEIFAGNERFKLKVEKTEIKSWVIIKLDDSSLSPHYYHNLVYWFLGNPPDDNNFADESIGISINKNDNLSYVVYNDYALRQEIASDDDLFGITKENQKFLLNVPFQKIKSLNTNFILEFDKFLKNKGIDLNEIDKKDLVWKEIKIELN